MQQHVVERKTFEATCCKEEPAETGKPGPLLCDDKRHTDSSMKLYNYIERCGKYQTLPPARFGESFCSRHKCTLVLSGRGKSLEIL